MAIFQRTIFDSSSPNGFSSSTTPMMQHIGEFTLRAGNRYLDIKTNLETQSAMLFFYFWGYLYNAQNCFGYAGCYPYNGTSILNKYIYNSASTQLLNIYKTDAPYNVCLKFDRQDSGYTEGKINVFIINHGLNMGYRVGVTSFAENNTASSYYS
jgi:hypothetical protein